MSYSTKRKFQFYRSFTNPRRLFTSETKQDSTIQCIMETIAMFPFLPVTFNYVTYPCFQQHSPNLIKPVKEAVQVEVESSNESNVKVILFLH